MYKIARPFFMVVETPLHAGSGTDLGVVDQPIQRERHTGFPKIEASGLKGCIREVFEKSKDEIPVGNAKVDESNRKETISLALGPEKGDDHAGALGCTDARLLLFPVKSMKGIFAWVTCPKVLARFRNDLELAKITNVPIPSMGGTPRGCQLFIKDRKIVLEEYTFEITKNANVEDTCSEFVKWLSDNVIPEGPEYTYWREKIKTDVAVLSDDDFRDFVNLSTEVITRIKIDPYTGTVQQGALFTEEYLPSETILYSLALATPIFKEKDSDKGVFRKTNDKSEESLVMEYFSEGLPEVIQIGGNATIGKGIVRTRTWSDDNE
ncbi:MAG: type III-B CRISPR module RAMP protein Cmr4 [Nitrospiraceae bacterium]|nr:type III-B CRISPR module RAMP protein Cmr4 [Nitrospiraceae bacterium]